VDDIIGYQVGHRCRAVS